MDVAKTARFRVYAEVDRWPPLIRNWRIAENRKDNPSKTISGELSANRVPPKRICYFQFDRDIVLKDDNVMERVLDAYVLDFLDESIGRVKEKTYIFLDEIQLVPRWSDIVKRYLDRDPALTFVVSGSSSLLLESESAESLAGRLDMLR